MDAYNGYAAERSLLNNNSGTLSSISIYGRVCYNGASIAQYIHHCRVWTRIIHLIHRPNGPAMGCILWGFGEKWPRYNGTALYISLLKIRHVYFSSLDTQSRNPLQWLDEMMWFQFNSSCNEPLTRYVTLWVTHALGMSGTFSPPPTSKETAG